MIVVTVRCVACRHTRIITDAKAGDVPICERCFAPMLAVLAERKP